VAGAADRCQRFGAAAGYNAIQFFCDFIRGSIPRDPLPFAGAALPDIFERLVEAVFVVKVFDKC